MTEQPRKPHIAGRDIDAALRGAGVGRNWDAYGGEGGNGSNGAHASDGQAQSAPPKPWPAPMDKVAYYGVLGRIAREIQPFIETSTDALLINLMVMSGIALGREAYLQVGATRHRAVLNALTIGATGDNKSDSVNPVLALMEAALALPAPEGVVLTIPAAPPLLSGLSTGEGLLWQIRDRKEIAKQDPKTHATVIEVVDEGVFDKRLLIEEAEFARVLSVMGREGNTLSSTIRRLYDSHAQERSSPKNNAITVTGPHVGLIGQITPQELERKLNEMELYNGGINRYVTALTRRERSLPRPPSYATKVVTHAQRWRRALSKAWSLREITYADDAATQWQVVYEQLRKGTRPGMPLRRGMTVEACARAHVVVMRLSLIFAAFDGSAVITRQHQDAALAIWDYAERCAAYLFGGRSGDRVKDTIVAALRAKRRMTRTELRDLFHQHLDAAVLQAALDALAAEGTVKMEKVKTGGRSIEYWVWSAS